MKSKLKRIFSALLSMTVLTCTLPVSVITTSAEEPVYYQCDAQAIDNIQDGVILHCFDWKYTDIIAELPNIAAAGFNAVQTSPAQPGGNHDPDAASGTWWWLYQPLSFSIGTNYLGTKAELTQLCTEAHKYGIEVIVDIVANHLAGDHTYIQDALKDSQYWRPSQSSSYWDSVTDNRYKTTHKDLGMPDIVSEDAYVQECVKNYVQELKSVGVDGLRWDTLKHIQVPSENCVFFTTVLDKDMYNYGEILGDPGGSSESENVALMQEYTGLMSVTDDVCGNGLRSSLNSGSVPTSLGNWAYRGVNANKLLYWAESHDTWSNDEKGTGGNGYTTNISQNVIDRTYALVASRAGATSLYFSRPSAKIKNNILAGVKGSTHFTNPEVAAVNHFHNAFNGQSEYYSTSGNIAYIERGKKGVVLVNAPGGSTSVSVPANKMMDGTYTDQITGNIFTVANGYISGNIGSTGIAVVYNPGDTEEPYIKNDTMYFQPNSTWKANNSRFAMYLWDGSGNNTWADMTDTDGDGTYAASVPAGKWTGIIFCCMKGSTTENAWSNKTYQTLDLFPDENTDRYTLRSGVGTETESTKGTWDSFHTHSYGEPAWEWADGYSSATATFTCSGCENTVTATDSAPVADYISTVRRHTATVTGPDGEESCTAYEHMVVQQEPAGGVEFQIAHTDLMLYLYEKAMAHQDVIDVSSYGLTSQQVANTIQALLNCCPELFFVDRAYGHTSSIAHLSYNMGKTEADEKLNEFYAKVDEYLSLLNDNMDDFTKALILHDRLVLDHYYQIETETEYSSGYTFMLDGWGRCENYTEVYAYLLAREGIKSEIIGYANHEWMMVCLDGQYYHVDVTWDDPYSTAPIAVDSISNRSDKVRRTFFLLSDTALLADAQHGDGYNNYNKATDTSYDGYANLHGNDNLICYVNGELYTLYENDDNEGVIAVYNPESDTYTDCYLISDTWQYYDNIYGYWPGNFSSIAEYNGLLYFNGEHTINIYDPATGSVQEYYRYNDSQLYGMYIQDGQIYGLIASDPSSEATVVSLIHVPYTVRWVNYDGTELKRESVTGGTVPYYGSTTPTRESTAQYDYTFSGWTPDITAVMGNITYTAKYTPSLRNYTVVWQDYDGTELETDTNVPYGTTPTYDSETPSREGYTFKDWNPEVTTVTGNAVYTAEYDIIPTGILITEYNFANWDEVYIYYWGGTSSVAWPGVEMTPADDENFKFTYTIPSDAKNIIFDNGYGKPQTATLALTDGTEWSVSLTNTTVNANPYPTYYLIGSMNNWTQNDTSYTFVPNMNENGFEEYVLTTELSANDAVKVFGGTGYYPSGGETSNYTVAADGTYQIYFRRNSDGYNDWHGNTLNVINVTPYTVAFSDGVASQTVTYGDCAAEPAQPSKENYTFIGWYLDGGPYDFNTPVTADITLTAHWLKNAVDIQFIDVSGKVKTTLTITPINNSFANVSITEIPSTPYLDGYAFTGWTVGENSYSDADTLKTALESLVAEEPEDDIIVKEVYTQAETLYTVTVYNGTVRNSKNDTSGSYKASDQIYVTATGGSPEQDFSYWTKQDEGSEPVIVGYEETYAFRMPSKPTILTAVYEGKKDKLGTAYIESVTVHDTNKISFVSIVSVPEDATMLRAGIVACKESDLVNGHTEPTIDYARFKRYNDTNCVGSTTFKYTWTKGSVNSGDIWCVRAYLLYKDANGQEKTVYSNMVRANLDGIITENS